MISKILEILTAHFESELGAHYDRNLHHAYIASYPIDLQSVGGERQPVLLLIYYGTNIHWRICRQLRWLT